MPYLSVNTARRLIPLSLLMATFFSGSVDAREVAPVRVVADHHLHLNSPAMTEFLATECEVAPGRKCLDRSKAPLTAANLIAAMDHAGIKHGLLVSTAYFAESIFIKPPSANGPAVLRASNDYTVAVARAYPARLKALVGINPLTATALPEIERWRSDRHVVGIKLHLANSGFDFRKPGDVAKLAEVFRAAARNRMVILIHMRTSVPDFGRVDTEIFIRDVLPHAAGSYIQVAHAAGWGGITEHTIAALTTFADAFDREPRLAGNIYFDLAAVIGDSNEPTRRNELAALIQRIGSQHFLSASDYPLAPDLLDHYTRVYPMLPLSAREWRVVRGNIAPYVRPGFRRSVR